jgi:hypothetical protein
MHVVRKRHESPSLQPPTPPPTLDAAITQMMADAAREDAARPKSEGADVVFDAEEPLPFIPPGQYQAVGRAVKNEFYPQWEAKRGGGGHKVKVEWDVFVPDADFEMGFRPVRLFRQYNVGKKNGRYIAPRSGDLLREWALVTRRRPRGRCSVRVFVGMACLVEVVTVEKNAKGRARVGEGRYSKVGAVLQHLAGGSLG